MARKAWILRIPDAEILGIKVIGVNKNKISQNENLCRAFVLGKTTRSPRKSSAEKSLKKVTTRAVERLYPDVLGPLKVRALGWSKYFVTLLDEHTRYSLVRFIHRKSVAADFVMEMTRELEILFKYWTSILVSIKGTW